MLVEEPQPPPRGRNVQTSLNYYDDPGDGSPPTPVIIGGTTVTNERHVRPTAVTVMDIAGREPEFDLDSCGFQLVRHNSSSASLEDGYRDVDKIKSSYFPECEQLVKDVTGASRVFIFDHKVRRGPADWHSLGANNSSQRGPLHRVHVDQSYEGAEFLLGWYLGRDEAERRIRGRGRWQIINAWRPIATIRKDPLAVADARTIDEADLVAAKVIYPDHQRETWTVKPSGNHKWYYKSAQTAEEVMLIKCFDTADGRDGRREVARRVPHSAFRDDEFDGEAPRESIEVRAFVFYAEEGTMSEEAGGV